MPYGYLKTAADANIWAAEILGGDQFWNKRLVSLKVLPSTDWGHRVTRSDGCLLCLWSWKVLAGRVGFSRVVHASCFSLRLESMAPAHVQISQSKGISHLPQGYYLIVLAAVFWGFSMYKGQMSNTSIILVPLEYLRLAARCGIHVFWAMDGLHWVCLGQDAYNSSRLSWVIFTVPKQPVIPWTVPYTCFDYSLAKHISVLAGKHIFPAYSPGRNHYIW